MYFKDTTEGRNGRPPTKGTTHDHTHPRSLPPAPPPTSPTSTPAENLRAEVASLTTDNQHLRDQHQNYLVHMSARAKEVAEENDWCSVAQNLVEELGGIWPTEPTYDITITHTWRIRARLAPGMNPDQVTDTYITDSLRLWETPTMDDDWTECTPIETVGFKVTQYAATE